MEQKEKLVNALAGIFEKDPAQLRDDTNFQEDLGATSSHYFMMIAEIQDSFGIKLTYSKIKKCKTIGDLLTLTETLVK
ncbi:MAG: acyl carrier protein [Oscillospiraceae bacterium]